MNGMKIDFVTNTVIITKAFREAANEYGSEEYIALTNEFNARETKEANFAHLCDKLDFDIQMKLYTDRGLISLDENYDSPVFKSGKIKEILANGAKTPSDVFYEYDVNKYKDSNEFKSLLDYSYSIDLYERLESYLKDIK